MEINAQDAVKAMESAVNSMQSEAFHRAASQLSERQRLVRENLQSLTSVKMNEIISKLGENKSLTEEDMKLMKHWIVGDAESYTAQENDLQNWLVEFGRLKAILAGCEQKERTSVELFKMHGAFEDAMRVSYDIANYLEKKERIQKFEAACAQELDADARQMLIRILKGKLLSAEY